ncbi:hypothetical protein O2W14_13970 [Modestobacter sp. VKM Ac-2986]|uniref:hypothetical protein n=1 Tax=Modestobacter sp. VKM Ac-2986 TaxID=3004140 RepID=UPI0022AB7F7E|nr:hypothetical protein [Modestobacter sp. VKM Ac-2986]MCZ2829942.1 hypothetical protein [Modestobacter sp. VKM Ac-2986]
MSSATTPRTTEPGKTAFDWAGAGLLQVTLLPVLGLAALALVDVRRMVLPPRLARR